jgi:hypothetical protein
MLLMKTQTNKLKLFEVYVLRLISYQFLLTGILYFLFKQWWTGSFIFVMWFLFGVIGQGLKHNRERSLKELTKGQDWDLSISYEDGILAEKQVIKPFIQTIFIVSITSVILLLHHNFRFYIALPIGLLIGFIYPFLFFFIGIYIDRLICKIK